MPGNMTPEEIQDVVDRYNQAIKDGTPITDDLNEAMKNAASGVRDYSKQLKASKDQLLTSFKNLGMAYVNGEHGAAMYNDVIKSGAKTFSTWNKGAKDGSNIMGKTAEVMAEAENIIAKQADTLFKGYQDLSRSGLALGMQQAFDNLEKAGFTMKEIGEYSAVMSENATQLAILGGTAADGADKFANISKEIVKTDMSNQLMMMGQSLPEINKGISRYIKYQQISGQTIDRDARVAKQKAEEFILQQDILTKLTGASADEQMKIYQTGQGEQQFAGKRNQLQSEIAKFGKDSLEGKKVQAQLDKIDETNILVEKLYGPQAASDLRMQMAGAVNSPGFRRAAMSAPGFANAVYDQSKTTGEVIDGLNKEIKNTTDNMGWLAQFGAYNDHLINFQESLKSNTLVNTNYGQTLKKAASDQKMQRKGADDQTKGMVGILQKQRDLTQKSDQTFIQAMPFVTRKLSDLAGIADDLGSALTGIINKDTGRIGGESPGLYNNIKSFLGFGKSTASAGSAGAAASTVGPTNTGGGGGATPGATADIGDADKLINFTGGTGDKNHFMQLDPKVQNNFVQMANAYYNATGKKLTINSAFRSVGEQASVNSGGNPKAAPGKSLHNYGLAVDINSDQKEYLLSSGLLSQYGFSPLNNDPPHIQMPHMATGGVLSGPTSGYTAMLHGNEAVVPLPDGKTIPVQHSGNSNSREHVKLLSEELAKLDSMLNVMQRQNDITNKILHRQS